MMAKTPKNHGKPWTKSSAKKLADLAQHNTPTRVIGIKMGRSPESIYAQASRMGISLHPTNQSPYGTKGKRR